MVKGYLTIFRKGTTSSSNLPDGYKMEATRQTSRCIMSCHTPRPQGGTHENR